MNIGLSKPIGPPPSSKPNLLFITRTWPDSTGTGTSMRCGLTLEAMAEIYNIYLLVIPILDTPLIRGASPRILGLCARYAEWRVEGREDPAWREVAANESREARLAAAAASPRTRLGRFVSAEAVREAGRVYADIAFQAVHVFRLDMAPFAEPFLAAADNRPFCVLDLDDIESETRRCIAALYAAGGDTVSANFELLEMQKYERMERDWLPRFDEVWVCSEGDREEVAARYGCPNVLVVPNAVRMPSPTPTPSGNPPFTLLLLGSMGYYPNRDAALYLCAEILPRLRELAGQPFRVLIAGRDSLDLREVIREPEVTVLGPVPDVAPLYAAAGAAVVPLRAGGGTRIKILEAFSYRRPVVSTSMGAAGLRARHRSMILLADSPGEFARHCHWIMRRPGEAASIAGRAYGWVRDNHSLQTVTALLKRARALDHGRPGPAEPDPSTSDSSHDSSLRSESIEPLTRNE